MRWSTVITLFMVIILVGWPKRIADVLNNNPVSEREIYTEEIPLPEGKESAESCRLCGRESLWHYYHKKDSIGVINLANGQISDLEILMYDDNGLPVRSVNRGYRFNTDSGRYVYLAPMSERGICELSMSWEADKYLNMDEIASVYCKDCMEKIRLIDNGLTGRIADNRCPFAMIDFKTGELYSLNGIVTACFIRDYYMHFDFEERRIEGVIFFAPEYINKGIGGPER